jgi:hypothetical protein
MVARSKPRDPIPRYFLCLADEASTASPSLPQAHYPAHGQSVGNEESGTLTRVVAVTDAIRGCPLSISISPTTAGASAPGCRGDYAQQH